MIQYQNNFPYERRAGQAQLTLHATDAQYQLAYKMKSKYPAQAMAMVSKVFSSSQGKADAQELKKYVDQQVELNRQLGFFAMQDWVFDSASSLSLDQFIKQTGSHQEI